MGEFAAWFAGSTLMKRRRILSMGACMIILFALLGVILAPIGTYGSKEIATWDFRKNRSSTIISWPADKQGRDWWSPYPRHYKKITILLVDRPPLVSERPVDVFFDRAKGEIIKIKINEEPVTQEKAMERLRTLAKEWDWPWDEATYKRWVIATTKGNNTRIGAGDKPDSKKWPYVSASILHSAATPDRPWFIQLHVTWREEDVPWRGGKTVKRTTATAATSASK